MNDALAPALDVPLRLLLAVLAGAAIGLNRWLRHKPAGLGTHSLVALGSALATVIVTRAAGADAEAASRVIQGVLTGVGFIGAGVIMRENQAQQVHGLTTAASIWTCGLLGVACGMSDWAIGTTGLVLALLVLGVSKPLEDRLDGSLARRRSASAESRGGQPK